jgi:hypothetical protein
MKYLLLLLLLIPVVAFSQVDPSQAPIGNADDNAAIYHQEGGQLVKVPFPDAKEYFLPSWVVNWLSVDITDTTGVDPAYRGFFVVDQDGDMFYVDPAGNAKQLNSGSGGGGGFDQEEIEDFIAAMVTMGTQSGITITYDDPNGQIDFIVPGGGPGGGETNVGQNLGGGSEVFAGKVDTTFQYRTLVGGTNVSLSSDANEITINALDEQGLDLLNLSGTTLQISVENDGQPAYTVDLGSLDTQLSQEEVEDLVGGLIAGGSNVTVNYDDGANTLTISATDTQLTQEEVEDYLGGMLTGTQSLITVAYDDINGEVDFTVEPNLSAYNNDAGFLTTEVDGSVTNELQDFDVATLSGTQLQLSLSDDPTTHTIELGPLQDGTLSQEEVEDFVGGLIQAGVNVTVNYDDGANILTISAIDTQLSQEEVEDIVGGLATAGVQTGISVTYDDVNNQLNFIVSGGGPGGGETNVGQNLGSGSEVFAGKVDTTFQFRTLVGGTNVSLSSDANEITINALDEQGLDLLNLSGTTLQISVENDGQPAYTVDLGSIDTHLSQEEVEDLVGGLIAGGSNVTVNYDDVANTLTISATDTQLTQEEVEDYLGGMLTGTQSLITVAYDDINGEVDFTVEPNLSAYNNDAGFLTSEVDGSVTNELQDFDVTALSGTQLQLSLTQDPTTHTIELGPLQDGQGMVDFTWGNGLSSTLIEDGETISVQGGTGIDVAGGGTNDLALNLDFTELILSGALPTGFDFAGNNGGLESRVDESEVREWIEDWMANSFLIAGTDLTGTYNDVANTYTFDYSGSGGGSGGGETNVGQNLGGGSEVFADKVDTTFQFRTLVGGTNVSLSSDANEITINALDEQGLDLLNLSGTTLQISVENDGQPAYTVDLGAVDTQLSQEEVEDLVGGLIAGGSNVTVNYDDVANTLTISATDTQLTQEEVEDYLGGMLTGTQSLITVTYDDANGEVDFTVEPNLSAYNNDAGFLTSEVDGSVTNELQDFDVTALSGTQLQLSLTQDPTTHTIELGPLQDGQGMVDFTWGNGLSSTLIEDGETISVQGGTGIDVAGGGTNDLALNLDFTELILSGALPTGFDFAGNNGGLESRVDESEVREWIEDWMANSFLIAGTDLTGTYNDVAGTFTLDYSGSGGTSQTLAEVLTEGNIANIDINLNSNDLTNVEVLRLNGTTGYFDLSANAGPTLSARLSTTGNDFYRLKSSTSEVTFPMGNVGIGDFSGDGVAAGLHIYGENISTLRLSDSCSTDDCAQAYIDFYRGHNQTHLGRFGFDVVSDPHLYITNHLGSGRIRFQTDGVTSMELLPNQQLLLSEYGTGSTFSGTVDGYLAVTATGEVIKASGTGGGGADPTFPMTNHTATATQDIDFQNRTAGHFQIDLSNNTVTTLTFTDPETLTVPTYHFHFQGVGVADTITFPDSVYHHNGTELNSRQINSDTYLECFYDAADVAYYCSDTLGIEVSVNPPPPPPPANDTISNLAPVWYVHADSITGTNDGNPLLTWDDLTANNYNFSQGNATFRPTYLTNILNGKAGVDFDGGDDIMTTPLTYSMTTDEWTIAYVITMDGTGGPMGVASHSNSSNGAFTLWTGIGNTDEIRSVATDGSLNSQYLSDTIIANAQSYIVVVNVNTIGNSANIYVNGTLEANVVGTASISNMLNQVYPFNLGSLSTVSTLDFDGKIHAAAWFDSALTTAEMLEISTYLNNQYNVY